MFKFEKYQRATLGSSSSDSVPTLVKKFGRHFPRFVWMFFKKEQPKKWNFHQNRINFTKILVILTKK